MSLVDDPAVGESEWVVMKRAGDDTPDSIQEALEQVQKDSQDGQASSQLFGDSTMGSDPDINELVEQMEQTAKAASEAAEAASEAADAATEETESADSPDEPSIEELQERIDELEGQQDPEGQESQEAEGQDGLSEEARGRIQSLEEQAVEAGILDEEETTDWESQEQEGDSDLPEQTEKRLNSIEKALDGEGHREGQASALDGEDWVEKDSGQPVKDIRSAVEGGN